MSLFCGWIYWLITRRLHTNFKRPNTIQNLQPSNWSFPSLSFSGRLNAKPLIWNDFSFLCKLQERFAVTLASFQSENCWNAEKTFSFDRKFNFFSLILSPSSQTRSLTSCVTPTPSSSKLFQYPHPLRFSSYLSSYSERKFIDERDITRNFIMSNLKNTRQECSEYWSKKVTL